MTQEWEEVLCRLRAKPTEEKGRKSVKRKLPANAECKRPRLESLDEGTVVHVLWNDGAGGSYYRGTITDFRPSGNLHYITYDEGGDTWTCLQDEDYYVE